MRLPFLFAKEERYEKVGGFVNSGKLFVSRLCRYIKTRW